MGSVQKPDGAACATVVSLVVKADAHCLALLRFVLPLSVASEVQRKCAALLPPQSVVHVCDERRQLELSTQPLHDAVACANLLLFLGCYRQIYSQWRYRAQWCALVAPSYLHLTCSALFWANTHFPSLAHQTTPTHTQVTTHTSKGLLKKNTHTKTATAIATQLRGIRYFLRDRHRGFTATPLWVPAY